MQQTIKNLVKAFIGESQARNRYTFYAKIAQEEGYEQIAEIFLTTANNEKEHAKRLFEHIKELKESSKDKSKLDKIYVEAFAPTIYQTTKENLQAAIEGEHYENTEMYPEFAKTAEKENLLKIAARLKSIAIAEKHHEQRYKKILEHLKNNSIFKKTKPVQWVCRECGYVHTGKQPPEKCPSCDHEKNFYQIMCEEY